MSPLKKANPRRVRASARLADRPRTRLSITRTWAAPASSSWSTSVEPISPAPPVTSTVAPSIRCVISGDLLQCVDHGVLLLDGHFGKQRQRQTLAGDRLGHREVPGLVPEMGVR